MFLTLIPTSLLSARLFSHAIATGCKFLVLAQVTVFFFRACLRACDWLHLSCAFHRLHYSRACDWLYMFSAHATGYIFSRACLRACDWLRVSRACHSLHFFPRLRLIVHGFRACHRLHFFRPCLRSCDWLYKFPALAMVGYIFHAYRFLRFKHFVLSHRVFCANRSF